MKVRFNQKMVTIEYSDHHFDDKELRDERLFQATLAFAKAVKASVDAGDMAAFGTPDAKVQCLYTNDDRTGKFIQVLVYGIPPEKRLLFLNAWNAWQLPANRWMGGAWFRADEIGLNVEFCDGDVCNIYSRMIVKWNN